VSKVRTDACPINGHHPFEVVPIARTGACVFIAALTCAIAQGYGAEFEVEGVAVDDVLHGDVIQTSITNQFLVAFRDGEYRIRTWPEGSSNYIECAWDGKALRTVVADYRPRTGSGSTWLNAAMVEAQVVPTAQFPLLPALWLAYCSGAYLGSANDSLVEPVWPQDNPLLRRHGFRVKAHWRLCDSEPRLPEAVTFLNDGVYHGYDKENMKPIEVPLPPPYGEGFTNAVYRANLMTNLASLSLPIEFFLRQYRTPLGTGVRAGTPRATILGRAVGFRTRTPAGTFCPVFSGDATVCDYRFADRLPPGKFRDDGYVQYTATGGSWASGEELESKIYTYTRSAKIMPGMVAPSLRPHGIRYKCARTAIVLAVCSPLLVLLWKALWATHRSRERKQT
jgi:hypothetical protein